MPPFLAKRFAGLPAWAWLAIVAGGLTIGLILRSRLSSTEGETETDATDIPTDYPTDEYAGSLDYPADGYGPNAIDTLGTGGYVNYPIQPIQPGINVTIGGGQPCDAKDKPKQKPQKGYQWVCRNGNWQLAPLGRLPGGGGRNKCGPKPRGGCGRRGAHWACKDGRWRCVGGGGRGGDNHDGGGRSTKIVTGGGPPASRKNHEPLAGLPRGQSGDAMATWAPGNPGLLVRTR